MKGTIVEIKNSWEWYKIWPGRKKKQQTWRWINKYYQDSKQEKEVEVTETKGPVEKPWRKKWKGQIK